MKRLTPDVRTAFLIHSQTTRPERPDRLFHHARRTVPLRPALVSTLPLPFLSFRLQLAFVSNCHRWRLSFVCLSTSVCLHASRCFTLISSSHLLSSSLTSHPAPAKPTAKTGKCSAPAQQAEPCQLGAGTAVAVELPQALEVPAPHSTGTQTGRGTGMDTARPRPRHPIGWRQARRALRASSAGQSAGPAPDTHRPPPLTEAEPRDRDGVGALVLRGYLTAVCWRMAK